MITTRSTNRLDCFSVWSTDHPAAWVVAGGSMEAARRRYAVTYGVALSSVGVGFRTV